MEGAPKRRGGGREGFLVGWRWGRRTTSKKGVPSSFFFLEKQRGKLDWAFLCCVCSAPFHLTHPLTAHAFRRSISQNAQWTGCLEQPVLSTFTLQSPFYSKCSILQCLNGVSKEHWFLRTIFASINLFSIAPHISNTCRHWLLVDFPYRCFTTCFLCFCPRPSLVCALVGPRTIYPAFSHVFETKRPVDPHSAVTKKKFSKLMKHWIWLS